MSLPLSDEDREKILHKNLEGLLAKYKDKKKISRKFLKAYD